MAPSIPKQRKVRLPENEEIAAKLLDKRQSMAEQPGGLSENQKLTLSIAHHNVCAAKEPIRTLGDLARTKKEKKTNETLCATKEFCSLHNIYHTLQGNDKREEFYAEARAY